MSDAVAHDAMPVEGIEDAKPVRAAGMVSAARSSRGSGWSC